MRSNVSSTFFLVSTFFFLPCVSSSTVTNLRRKTTVAIPSSEAKKLSDEIVGINLLIEDLNGRTPDANNDIRVNWVESLIDNVERSVREMEESDEPKIQITSLIEGISDLKNELMQAKEKITLSLLAEVDSASGFSEEKGGLPGALLDKAETLKTGITDLTYDLMLLKNDHAEKEKTKNEEGSDRDSKEVEKQTTNNSSKNASVMASLIEFGVDSDKIADYFGVSTKEMESTVEKMVMQSDVAFSQEEKIIDDTLEKEINFLTALGASEEEIKYMREEKKKSLGEFDP